MKYLRHINESLLVSDIEEAFLDLTDYGFIVFAETRWSGGEKYVIIKILKGGQGGGKEFYLSDIKETLMFAIPYLEAEYGLYFGKIPSSVMEVSNINVSYPYTNKGQDPVESFENLEELYKQDDKLVRNVNIKLKIPDSNRRLAHRFNWKVVESNITPSFGQEDIEECFLDITDCGFEVVVSVYTPYVSIQISKMFGSSFKEFSTGEIKEALMFAIPYLQSEYGLYFGKILIDKKILHNISTYFNGWSGYENMEHLYEYNRIIKAMNIKLKLPDVLK